MRLDLEQQALVDEWLREAHADTADPDGRFSTADQADAFVRKLLEAEPAGQLWVTRYARALQVAGAKQVCTAWKRRHRREVKTAKGTPVSVQSFAGVQQRDGTGKAEWVQVPLSGMSIDELRDHFTAIANRRDTLSREVRFVGDLIARMEAVEATTAGEALEAMEQAS